MFTKHKLMLVTASALSVVAPLALCLPAEAKPAQPAQTSTSVSAPAGDIQAAKTAGTYWTRDRMLNAKPVGVPKLTAKQNAQLTPKVATGKAGKIEGVGVRSTSGKTAVSQRFGPYAYSWYGSAYSAPATTTGKVFFTGTNGLNYVCSGSTVNSGGKTLVLTAGHCVSNGAGGWYNSRPWVFVPGYSNGYAPYGVWTARQLWTRSAYLNGANRAEDIGAALMYTLNGNRIVNAVGGQGYEWNYALSQYQYQFGYPQRAPFNGQTLKYCSGYSYNDYGHNGINCNMTEGASGGPWLDDFNGYYGRVDSVNSWVFWNSAGTRYKWNGPYFGNNARDFYYSVTAAEL